ncbi:MULTISPECIES: hypothetical protein [unclassified Microbacterium]|uniref:hypothetical protein n=1 Tax=unclassified Microbacterium TaxID=2609290 RepID=UPI000EA931DB|nr:MULTISPECIES: hypothetical protein [unclassified Microbacterium]MBT2485632.1 hypothetical protein [Microbacterium sp. ISL-108]RKN68410.1 hypothetical protein D7252_13000 [Microbacterium sp. CGR2]
MTLIPFTMRLATADARPLGRDAVVDAVLAVKSQYGTPPPDVLAALRDVGPVHADLVATDSEWIDGHPRLSYEVEDYRPLTANDIPTTLYRWAASPDGTWWSAARFDAWREGSGRHTDPCMWAVDANDLDVIASFRCRFGKLYSPREFVAIR